MVMHGAELKLLHTLDCSKCGIYLIIINIIIRIRIKDFLHGAVP